MERLAEKLKDILNEQDFCFEPREIKVVEKALGRLAAYEGTGLEPEEIQAIAGMASENCAKTADAIDKFLQDDAELKSYRELGPIDRLQELAQADREGRCVVLPKDGMVYFHEESIDSGEKWVGNWPIKDVLLKCGFGIASLTYSIRDVGSKIYFNFIEAEAALRREQE